jgi:hypothetical protein
MPSRHGIAGEVHDNCYGSLWWKHLQRSPESDGGVWTGWAISTESTVLFSIHWQQNAPMVHTDTLGSTALFHTNVIHCLLREVGAVLIQISQNASDG